MVLRSRSPEDTRAIGAAIAASLRPGDVVMLTGDLGAGKTCFVQGAARALGVTVPVTSPSFVLVREYLGDQYPRMKHADVYRLNALQELYDLGYEELFDPGSVVFIEWGDAVAGALPDERLEVRIEQEDSEERTLTIGMEGDSWRARAAGFEESLTPWRSAS